MFTTSQKDRMKNPDFRPILKAHEMAQCKRSRAQFM